MNKDFDFLGAGKKLPELYNQLLDEIRKIKELTNANRQVIELIVGMINFLRTEMEELKNGRKMDSKSDQKTGGSQG
jgi:hypothetical protein